LKTLLITNSYDETSDLLVRAFKPGEVFRLNYDLIRGYDVDISEYGMKISYSSFYLDEDEIAKTIWRKAFFGLDQFDHQFGAFEAAEYKYLLREIMNFSERDGHLVFNRPDAEAKCGKLVQVRLAGRHFSTPGFHLVSRNTSFNAEADTVIKSLASVPFDNGDVLYTTDVSGQILAECHLWYSQKRIDAQYDITVVYVYGQVFSFRLRRDKFSGLDWRKDPFALADKWEPHTLTAKDCGAICSLMDEVGWSFGRLDFLLSNDDLIFLEVNPNGQWAWLDPKQSNGLFAAMKNCVDPHSPMPVVKRI
jgi:hypothetical protein